VFSLPGLAHTPYYIGTHPLVREVYVLSLDGIIDAIRMDNGLLEINGPLWSLSIEFWTYFVVGLSVCLFTARGIPAKVLSGITAVICAKALFDVNEHSNFYLAIWLSGGLAAILRHRLGWFTVVYWKAMVSLFALTVFLGIVVPSLVLAGGSVFGPMENLMQFLIIAFLSLLALPNISLDGNWAGRALMRLGDCSYTLYIVHFPIMLFALSIYQRFGPDSLASSIVAALAVMVVCVVASSLAARLFENKKMFAGWLESALQRLKIYGRRLWPR
jgi:peptidoglycan/LPS O-acetylase OafA/YrhL